MGAFFRYGDVGVWASNRERNAFLDWFAENRCAHGDQRWEHCKSEGNRWTGCGVNLEELIPRGSHLDFTGEEYFLALETYGPHIAQLLGIVDAISRGGCRTTVSSRAALDWRRDHVVPLADPLWLTPTVIQIASVIRTDQAVNLLSVLADALEEAGLRDTDVLGHCRNHDPQVPHCWVIDLLLGKNM